MLVLDDLHEADSESLEVFRTLAARGQITLLASSPLPLGEGFAELELPPLDAAGLAELTREALGEAPSSLVGWLEQRSGGNVAQARALLSWLLDTDALERGPEGLSLRAARLEAMPPGMRRTPSERPAPDASAGLTTDPGGPPPGADDAELALARRRQRELAELIERVPGAAEERREELARLYGESDRPENAVGYARAAARAAAGRNRFALALSWTEAAARAAQLVDEPALMMAVRLEEAEAWHRLYDPRRSVTIAREVEAQARASGDVPLADRAALLAAVSLADGYAPGAEDACHAILVRASPASRDEIRARLSLARVLRGRGELGEAEVNIERAATLARGSDDEELRAHALIEGGLLLAEKGQGKQATAALEAAEVLTRAQPLARARTLVLLNLGVLRAGVGDVPGAEQAYRDAERLAGELGLLLPRAAALVNLADLHRDAGDHEQAQAFAVAALAEARRAGDVRIQAAALLARALSSGPEVDALAMGAEALGQLEPLEDASLFIEAATRLARLAIERGERTWAVELFTAARARAEATGIARHRRALDRLDRALQASNRPPPLPTASTADGTVTAPGS